jgi:hypothetical protein
VKAFTGVAVLLALLLVPSTGVAQAPKLPVGEAHGTRVLREGHHGIVVVLSRKMHKRFAGKDVIVACTTLLKDGSSIGSQKMRVARRSRRLVTGDVTPNIDYCRVWRPRTKHSSKRILVSVPLTQKGAVFLDEESKTYRMLEVELLASWAAEKQKLDTPATYDQLLRIVPKRAREAFSKYVVPLAAPTDTPPPRTVGYYSNGVDQVALAIVSASGRLLFIRHGPDDTLSTNVAGYMFNEPD